MDLSNLLILEDLSQLGYLFIAIGIIVGLIIIFFITYVMNKRTPIPKGCEELIDKEKCHGCSISTCKYYKESNTEITENKEEK